MADRAQIDAKITGDAKGFNNAVDQASSKASRFATGVLKQVGGAIAGAFAVGAIINFGRKLLRVADDMATAAKVFDVSLVSLIAWKSAMAESGIGAEKFMKIFGKIVSVQGDARRNVKTYTDALKDMNISVEEFKSIKPDEVLELFAKKLAESGGNAEYLQGMAKLLGMRLIELKEVLIRVNEEGMGAFREEAEKAAEGVKAAADASDYFEKQGEKILIWAFKAVPILGKVWDALNKIHDTTMALAILPTILAGLTSGVGIIESLKQGFDVGQFKDIWAKKDEIEKEGKEGATSPEAAIEEVEEKTTKQKREQARYERLAEESKMRSLKLLEKIAYINEKIAKSQKELVASPEDFKIKGDILENEMKRDALQEKANKEKARAARIGERKQKAEEKADATKVKSLKKLNEEEDKLKDRYNKELKDRDKGMTEAGKGIGQQTRFNEMARIGGQSAGGVSVEAGNALRQLAVEENQLSVTKSSDASLKAIASDIAQVKQDISAINKPTTIG